MYIRSGGIITHVRLHGDHEVRARRTQLGIEQQTPETTRDPFGAIGPLTENDLSKPVTVKLILMQLSELKEANRSLMAQLQVERGRNDALANAANAAQTEIRVLRESVRLTDKRDRVVRLIEFAMVLIISFMIDAAKSSDWKVLGGLGLAVLALGFAVGLIQWWPSKPENK